MKTMIVIAGTVLLSACSTTPSGSTGRTSSPSPPPKPAYCAFDPPSTGVCIGSCPSTAGDMSDPQYSSKYHSCVHECSIQTPRPECR